MKLNYSALGCLEINDADLLASVTSVQNIGFRQARNIHCYRLNNRDTSICHNAYKTIHVGEPDMDIAMISWVLFSASIAVFAYLVYKLSQKKTLGESIRKLRESVWYWVTCGFLALMLLLIGSVSRNVVTIVFGTFLLFAITSYVRSDHIVR